ncbi:MAG: hypothetical protein AAGB19_03585 [Cyanobacteria bacterium P01_F01_bin.3]
MHETPQLELTLDIPKGVSQETVEELILQAVLALDSLHRSFGGSGVKIETIETYEVLSKE